MRESKIKPAGSAKLTYDGKVVYDIDIDNDVYVVDGIDEYAWIRAAL